MEHLAIGVLELFAGGRVPAHSHCWVDLWEPSFGAQRVEQFAVRGRDDFHVRGPHFLQFGFRFPAVSLGL